MTGTRVLTALVLIPIVIALVLFTPTWAVALATALITILALREYFALGDAIGHRAYRLWTIFSTLALLLMQYGNTTLGFIGAPPSNRTRDLIHIMYAHPPDLFISEALFLFIL